MTNLEINVQDYLTDDELKAIIKSAVRDQIQGYVERKINSEKELTRILNNAAYDVAYDIVNNVCKNQMQQTLEEYINAKVKEILLDASSIKFEMFYHSSYGEKTGFAWTLMQQAIKDSDGLIKEKVKECITEYDFREVKERVFDEICNGFREAMFPEENKKTSTN